MTSAGSVGGDDRLRLFLALDLEPETLDALSAWASEHLRGGRTVSREHLHVTLAFLGDRPRRELPAIVDALGASCAVADPIAFEPAAWRETRSVGMIVLRDRDGAAARLAEDLHARLERLGVYRREARRWLPHVTVLRFRERPRLAPGLPAMGTFVPSGATAYLSRLHPSGARYEVLERVSLTAGG